MSSDRFVSRRFNNLVTAMLTLLFAACAGTHSGDGTADEPNKARREAGDAIPVLSIKVLKAYPHDPDAFTQGLEYFDGFLYESTGEVGHSSVRKTDLES